MEDWLISSSAELECLAISSELKFVAGLPEYLVPRGLEAKHRTYWVLAEDWEQVLEKIRRVDGFSNFLRPSHTPFSEPLHLEDRLS